MKLHGEYLTAHEAAVLLGVHRSRVAQFVTEGRLTPALTIGTSKLFRKADVLAFAAVPRTRTGRPPKADRQ